MIDFWAVTARDKKLYENFESFIIHRGCEYNFANLLLWGQQNIAVIHENLVRLSYYGGHISYAFPIGNGDKKATIDEIIDDAKERGIPCVFMGVYEEDKELLKKLYPQKFHFELNSDSFDYIYDINDLCDLAGRKYHSKRNHLSRFKTSYPEYKTEVLTKDNLHIVKELAKEWYEAKLSINPTSDFDMEQIALHRAIDHYETLNLEGLLLKIDNNAVAFTIGSRMTKDTFDVNFEKAKAGFEGAYPVINNEFAKHLRAKFPELKYLDREEDMGIEGLRKAKESYKPLWLTEKYMAIPVEVYNDN